MKIETLLVTGESLFLDRHRPLFTEMAPHLNRLEFMPREMEWYEKKSISRLIKAFYTIRSGSLDKANALFQKNRRAFILKSKRAEYKISQLNYTPDLVFHLFSTYRPLWSRTDICYAMYLDYTMALAEENWRPWACFLNSRERDDWLDQERQAYVDSYHIFTMSNVVKKSLVDDYGIQPQKVTIVGTSSNFQQLYRGEKIFGTQRILFNGSDFIRKGGDVLLQAFQLVRQVLPNANLTIVGKQIETEIKGVESIGQIPLSELGDLFITTDLVVAPARCEPFGVFLVDAMSYGVPCIVYAGSGNGITEFLEHEVDSIILPHLDPELFAQQIIRLLSNPSLLASMSQAAQEKLKTKLNWNTIAKTVVQTLSA